MKQRDSKFEQEKKSLTTEKRSSQDGKKPLNGEPISRHAAAKGERLGGWRTNRSKDPGFSILS